MICIKEYKTPIPTIDSFLDDKEFIKTSEGLWDTHNNKKKLLVKGTISDYRLSLSKKFIWCAVHRPESIICLMLIDRNGNKVASLEIKDEDLDAPKAFLSLLQEENKISICLVDGQNGAQGYCVVLEQEKLSIWKTLPLDQMCMFTFDKYALLADFYSSELILVSYPSFEPLITKKQEIIDCDFMENVWKVDNNFGILSTTQGVWYAFELNTLKIIDECAIEKYEPKNDDFGHSSYISTLTPTNKELFFKHWYYENKKYYEEWIAVDRGYLASLIKISAEKEKR